VLLPGLEKLGSNHGFEKMGSNHGLRLTFMGSCCGASRNN